MGNTLDQSKLDQIVRGVAGRPNIFSAVFHVSSDDSRIDLISASGHMEPDSPYYIASINKLVVSAMILRLNAAGKLALNDPIAAYLPEEVVRGLHVFQGREYSREITITHLLSQTSGLPCYLTDKQADGKRAMTELEAGIDQAWPIDKVIRTVKTMQPHFPPGQKGKAKYIDTNHQILDLVIERVTGKPIRTVLNALFSELKMTKTYVCEDGRDEPFAPVYNKSMEGKISLFINSTGNDIISTARDQMTFVKAFFNGYFFPKERLPELQKWNSVFFPFQYGVGIQKFAMPRVFSPFQPIPEFIGHCGSTGSVAFYVPGKKVFLTGTINQQAAPNLAFQTMIRITNTLPA